MYLKCTDGHAHQRKLLASGTSCPQVCRWVLWLYLVACLPFIIEIIDLSSGLLCCMLLPCLSIRPLSFLFSYVCKKHAWFDSCLLCHMLWTVRLAMPAVSSCPGCKQNSGKLVWRLWLVYIVCSDGSLCFNCDFFANASHDFVRNAFAYGSCQELCQCVARLWQAVAEISAKNNKGINV